MLDFSFEPPKDGKPKVLGGPPIIVSGHGCRLTVKTSTEVEGRNEDVLARLYAVVREIHAAGLPGVSEEPTEGYIKIYGGEPPFYVRGEDQRDVITTIGKGILSGPKSLAESAAGLGINALVEWS